MIFTIVDIIIIRILFRTVEDYDLELFYLKGIQVLFCFLFFTVNKNNLSLSQRLTIRRLRIPILSHNLHRTTRIISYLTMRYLIG